VKKKLLVSLVCLLLCGVFFVGRGYAASKTVGFVIRTIDSPYYVALSESVKKYCEALGWNCTVLDSKTDTLKEAENMETFITQKVDLIFLDCVDPNSAVPIINTAADAGIPVINLDSGVGEGAKDVTTVYSDNKQNGRAVGLAYAKKVGGSEVIGILLSGNKGSIAGQERRTGLFAGIIEGKLGISEAEAWTLGEKFNDDLTNNGKASNEKAKFSVGGQGWGAWSEEGGLIAAEDLITANKNLPCVLGENDQLLFGAMTALENAGIKNVDLDAAADGAKRAYDLIKQGKYFATGENSPVKVAEKGVQIAEEILVGGKDKGSYPEITMTEAVGVTIDKVDAHYDFGF
jgi:ribose transport system substrate-binding protein